MARRILSRRIMFWIFKRERTSVWVCLAPTESRYLAPVSDTRSSHPVRTLRCMHVQNISWVRFTRGTFMSVPNDLIWGIDPTTNSATHMRRALPPNEIHGRLDQLFHGKPQLQ